jgi:hypothetical protein
MLQLYYRFYFIFLMVVILSLLFTGCKDNAVTSIKADSETDSSGMSFKTIPVAEGCFKQLDSPGNRVINSWSALKALRDSMVHEKTRCDTSNWYRNWNFKDYTYLLDAQTVTNCIRDKQVNFYSQPGSDTITVDVRYIPPDGDIKCDVIYCNIKCVRIGKIPHGTPVKFSGKIRTNSWCYR